MSAACLLGACASPVERVERLADAAGFDRQVVDGDPFRHLVYVKRGGDPDRRVHVYIEGDGTPWLTRYRVADDPTPRRPLMLELMRLDPGPALYLGRPCYFDLTKACRPEHWTSARYGEAVVRSMVAALDRARRRLDRSGGVALIGHSGGGALVMLMAPRVADTAAVLTLAGNLDIEAWTRLHDYTPLHGSINPAGIDPLPARIRQLHVVGGEDRQVPPWITESGLARQGPANLVRVPGAGHHCCWAKRWRAILARLAGQDPDAEAEPVRPDGGPNE